MPDPKESLENYRRSIDETDARIFDLLLQRSSLVSAIGASKGRSDVASYQPAREAQLLRRLIDRCEPPLETAAIFGIWREIIAASVRQQGTFVIATLRSDELSTQHTALQHYGSNHRLVAHSSPTQVLEAIGSRQAAIGVLPDWRVAGASDWWRALAGAGDAAPRIVARLPFLAPPAGALKVVDAFVVAAQDTDGSGMDRSVIVVDGDVAASRAAVATAASQAGLAVYAHHVAPEDTGDGPRWHCLELDGHIPGDDPRLGDLVRAFDDTTIAATRIGGYAIPLAPEAQ